MPIQRIDSELEKRQVERVRALRARRDVGVHAAALRGVEEAAQSGAKSDAADFARGGELCDGGEIADVLRRVFGEYRESVVV